MAKRNPQSVIVLNAMYSGGYLNDNMGHEIINLFKTTNSIKIDGKEYRNFIYLNPYGNFAKDFVGAVSDMLMVISVPKKNKFEVVAKATGLVDIFKPVTGFDPQIKEDKKSDKYREIEAIVHSNQMESIGELVYGNIEDGKQGIKLTSLFTGDKQQAVFVTYAATEVCRPKERLFISFHKDWEKKQDEVAKTDIGYEITLISQNIGRQPQKQYFSRDSKDDNEKNDAKLLDDLLKGDYWLTAADSTSTVSKDERYELRKDSLINICRIEDNELAFSNALAFYIQRYPHFFAELLGFDQYNFSIEREWNHIDIYIKSGEKRIIVENKIHSGINCNKEESDYNNSDPKPSIKRSQLDRYWKLASEEVSEENVKAYIFCSEYKFADLKAEKTTKELGEKYEIISYKTIYKTIWNTREYNEDGNHNFRDFVDALYKHTLDSVPKVKYEEMKSQFITRIKTADNA